MSRDTAAPAAFVRPFDLIALQNSAAIRPQLLCIIFVASLLRIFKRCGENGRPQIGPAGLHCIDIMICENIFLSVRSTLDITKISVCINIGRHYILNFRT